MTHQEGEKIERNQLGLFIIFYFTSNTYKNSFFELQYNLFFRFLREEDLKSFKIFKKDDEPN